MNLSADQQRAVERAVASAVARLARQEAAPGKDAHAENTQAQGPVSELRLADCDRMIEAGIARAQAIAVPMVLAVVDEAGHMLELRRMDGALRISLTLAPNKAHTAAMVRMPTHALAGLAQPGGALYGIDANIARFTIVGGGLPLQGNGRTVGAVGVSGGSVEQDIEIARAMAQAL